jgi:hypothetical protein
MNVKLYQNILSAQLVDTNGNPLSATQLNYIMAQTVREYSRWRGLLRTFGVGGLATTATSGSTSIIAVGGPYAAGSTIYLDAYTPWQETAVISSVTQVDPSTIELYVGTPVNINLTAPLANTHYAGGLLANVNPLNTVSPTGGLNLLPNVQQYLMPGDFLSPEDNSWNVATGQKSYLKQYQTYYDSVYEYSSLVSGVDLGQAQNFIGGPFATFPGVPAQSNGSLAVPFSGVSQGYIFTGSGQVVLNVIPTPTTNYTFNFNYWALQQPETVPDSDMDALIAYGMYVAVDNNAVILSVYQDLRDIRQDVKSSMAAANSRELAQNYLKKFDTAIRLRPLATSG